MRIFHCKKCGSSDHTARNHFGGSRKKPTPQQRQTYSLWTHYRLRPGTWEAMRAEGCAICDDDLQSRTPDVEHDHTCDHHGKGYYCCRACVRGLTCRSCNLRVGAFERGLNSDTDIAEYLGRPVPTQSQMTLF